MTGSSIAEAVAAAVAPELAQRAAMAAAPVAMVEAQTLTPHVSMSKAEFDAELSQATAAGAAAERTRIAAILDSDEAKGRLALARHFAFKTAMAPADARAALAAAPVEKPAASAALADRGDKDGVVAAGTLVDDGRAPRKAAAAIDPGAIYAARAKN